MAGTVHGLVNKMIPRYSATADENANHIFAAIAHFFDHLCTVGGGNIMTRVASNYGGGTGFDFPGGTYPIGYNKTLGVWKMNTSTLRPGGGSAMGEVYICMIAGPTAGTTGWSVIGTNGDASNDGELMVAMAFREDGGNPWNGTVNNNGLDTPGLPLWTAGGSTVHVFPRCNNPGGNYATNKNLLITTTGASLNCYNANIVNGYFHGFADDDNWIFFMTDYHGWYDYTEPLHYQPFCFGMGDLQANCKGPGDDPYFSYFFMNFEMPFGRGAVLGDTTGAAGDQGGVKAPRGGIIGFQASVFTAGLDQVRSPNPYSNGGLIYDEKAIEVYSEDAWLGYGHEPSGTDFWRIAYGMPNESLDTVNERAAFGHNTTLSEKITVPWPSTIGEAPGATRTYDGVAF